MTTPTGRAYDPKTAPAILVSIKPTLLAIAKNELARVRLGRERVLDLSMLVRDAFTEVIPTLKGLFLPEVMKTLLACHGDLGNRALAFYAASLDAEAAWSSETRKRKDVLAPKVRSQDAFLFKWCTAIFHGDAAAEGELAAIAKGYGMRDDSEDVLREVRLLHDHPESWKGKSPITGKGLEQAEAEATELLALLSKAEEASPAVDLVRRAFTHWYRGFSEVARYGRFAVLDPAEAAEKFPGAYELKKATSKSEDTGVGDTSAPTPPAPADVATTA